MSGDRDGWLREVRPYLAAVPAGDDAPEVLHPVRAAVAGLERPERRVVLFGALGVGKSTLLDALLGVDLLPSHRPGCAHPVVTVRRAALPALRLVYRDGREEQPPFDQMAQVWSDAGGGAEIAAVEIAVPLPLLAGDVMVVDTPGLLGEEAARAAAESELDWADLAIMVLAADKILAAEERIVAAGINERLRGNMIFIVNRLDAVDEDDREDVLAWAARALRGAGNALVGAPRIIGTSAADPVVAHAFTPPAALWNEIFALLAGETGERIAVRSRLGVLADRLAPAAEMTRGEHEAAVEHLAAEQARHQRDTARQRAALRREVSEGQGRVAALRDALPARGEAWVAALVTEARQDLATPDGAALIRARLENALTRYEEEVRDDLAAALAGVPMAAPPFALSQWVVRGQIEPAGDAAAELGRAVGDALTRLFDGGRAGREAGAAIGGWIGKRVLGIDPAAETIRRIENLARTLLAPAEREVRTHLNTVLTLLAEAGTYYQSWEPARNDVDSAQARERYWSALHTWCRGCLGAVERVLDAL